jgi:hypothetical protein
VKQRIALVACAAVAALVATPALGTPGLPLGMASLGGADGAGPNSWSTGTNPIIRSHWARLKQITGSIRVTTFANNRFRTVADLQMQVQRATASDLRYFTVDVGSGDLCAGTPFDTFRARLAKALTTLSKSPVVQEKNRASDQREILLVSIENLAQHWRVLGGKGDLGCGLGAGAAVAQIQKRTIALNDIMARVCYRTTGCLFDAGARYRMPLRANYFSAIEPRRLSVEGERALATVEWRPAYTLLSAMS